MKNYLIDNGIASGGPTFRRICKGLTASASALVLALAAVTPAWSTIDNTVTARGEAPGGDPLDTADDITATDNESVDVEDSAPVLAIVKTVFIDADADGLFDVGEEIAAGANITAGTTVNYNFVVTNNGNVTVTNLSINESAFDGDSAINPLSGGSATVASLAPAASTTFVGTYTVTAGDIADEGGGDGNLDNTANATATAPAIGGGTQTVDSPDDTASFDLEDAAATMTVAKDATAVNGAPLADPLTANVAVGDVITYTYTVTNTGNVPLTDVTLSDNVTAGSGADPVPGSETLLTDNGTGGDSDDTTSGTNGSWDTLGPLDVITFTGTYTVTQSDIDSLQ